MGELISQKQQSDYELKTRQILELAGVTQRLPLALEGRSQVIYDQIKSYVVGKQVLDLGCGDGKVGELAAKDGLEVVLADVYHHDHVSATGLPFQLLRLDQKTATEKQYDTTKRKTN